MITIGIAIANIVNAILASVINSFDNALWRTALGIQAAPGIILFIMLFWLPHSPRQLVERGREDEAQKVIAKVNSWELDAPETKAEVDDIRSAIEQERKVGTASWSELLKDGIINRVVLGIMLQLWQQWTGVNAIMYYSVRMWTLWLKPREIRS